MFSAVEWTWTKPTTGHLASRWLHRPNWAILEKIQTGGSKSWGYKFSRDIEERTCGSFRAEVN